MEFLPDDNDLIAIGVSLLAGSLVGIEREYKNKSAGFRTIVLICLGATAFTIVSRFGVGSDDRIAANIITGIGFIGAGVIFKDKFSVMGLTTAAVIWDLAKQETNKSRAMNAQPCKTNPRYPTAVSPI